MYWYWYTTEAQHSPETADQIIQQQKDTGTSR